MIFIEMILTIFSIALTDFTIEVHNCFKPPKLVRVSELPSLELNTRILLKFQLPRHQYTAPYFWTGHHSNWLSRIHSSSDGGMLPSRFLRKLGNKRSIQDREHFQELEYINMSWESLFVLSCWAFWPDIAEYIILANSCTAN